MPAMPTLRDLNKLNSFVRVAERLSFTKAAEDLRTRPSALSKHMTELEEALGFSVLNRSTHGVVLTEAGEGLFKRCLQLLANLDEYIVETRNEQSGPYGVLRVHAASGPALWFLAPLVADFARRHPTIRIQVSTDAETFGGDGEGFDVILADKKPQAPGMIEADIGGVDHVICASPAYFRGHGRPKTPADLRDHNCFANNFAAPRGWWFETSGRKTLIEVKGALISNSAAVLKQAALEGLGIARLPRHSVEAEIADKTLLVLFEGEARSPERLRAYFTQAKRPPAKIALFVDFLREAAKSTRRGPISSYPPL